jgi:predicted amidohydrolase YtcJ
MPNLIFYNGKLHTQDERYPNATAIAVKGNKILALGSDDEMLAFAHAATEKIDLHGRRVLPGLADAHIHFYEWAVLLRMLVLDETRSLDDLLARVKVAVVEADAGAWIVGQGWNQDNWDKSVLPTKARFGQGCAAKPRHFVAQGFAFGGGQLGGAGAGGH